MRRFGWLFIFISMTQFSFAENLEDVYQLAVRNDQTFQNATATRQASAEALPQAMAVLFPQISAVANTVFTRQWTADANPNFATNGLVKYNNNGYTLSLAMPIINFNEWYNVREQKANVKAADATYADATQSLIIRTSQAYFNVLQAEDSLRITRAQKAVLEKQLAQSKARYEVGVDALTSVYNAQAGYDSALAQEITDENTLYASYQNLDVITGKSIDHLSRLIDNMPLISPNPNDVHAWEKASEDRNFSLLALKYTAEAAREGIKASNSNHLPVLSTVNSYQYDSESPNNQNPSGEVQTTSQVGLQLNVPLFEGGQVMSQTRQAQDVYVEALTNMELQHRQVNAQTDQVYTSVLAGMSKLRADRATIVSATSALESNQAAYEAGTMTIVDVLQAVQHLYNAEQTYTADQYAYLMNTLTLKQLAGNLSNLDVLAINRWLTNGFTTSAIKVNQEALSQAQKNI